MVRVWPFGLVLGRCYSVYFFFFYYIVASMADAKVRSPMPKTSQLMIEKTPIVFTNFISYNTFLCTNRITPRTNNPSH